MKRPRAADDQRGPSAVRRGLAAATAVGWLMACSPVVRGEDDRAGDEVLAVGQQQQENWIDLGANFDTNVFQHQGGGFVLQEGRRRGPQPRPATPAPESPSGGAPKSAALPRVRKLGERRLARIEAVCGLSEAQRRKLVFAMESDIRRLADEIDVERRKYQGPEVNLADQSGQRTWQQFQQDVQRCRNRLLSIFDTDSLLTKVLATTLDAGQQARLAAETDARRTALWKSLVSMGLLKFDDIMGLDQKQHAELERLLLEKQPPLRIEGFANGQNQQHFEQMLVWMALAEIDSQRLRAGLSERQAALIAQFAAQGKAMRSHVEAQGFLEKESL